MKFTRNGSVTFIAGAIVSATVVIGACSDDESTSSSSSSGGSSGTASSSGTTSSSGASSSGGGSSGGSSGTTTDGGGGGKKAIGEGPCTDSADCLAGDCYEGKVDTFCTFKCSLKDDIDPICKDAALSGKCNLQGYCQKK